MKPEHRTTFKKKKEEDNQTMMLLKINVKICENRKEDKEEIKKDNR